MLIDSERTKRLLKAYGFHAPKMTVDKLLDDDTFAVDAVEVVRCKDCECWRKREEFPDLGYCRKMKNFYNENEFCSRAERIKE